MEILIAIFIVACLAVIYYWIFDAKQKEKQELIKEQINGLIESHTNQLKSEGVNVDTVYTYQDNAFKQLDWSKAVAFRLIVDVANRQIVICNDLSNPFSPQKFHSKKSLIVKCSQKRLAFKKRNQPRCCRRSYRRRCRCHYWRFLSAKSIAKLLSIQVTSQLHL